MITIEEKKNKNCPGITSLFIKFDYRPELVYAIKNCSGSFYDKKEQCWETSIGYLSYLIDSFSEYDDIKLILLKDTEEKTQEYKIYELQKGKLMSHQKEAINYGLQDNHKQWLLLDTMGLGKTFSSIALAYNLKKHKNIKKVLIVCCVNAVKNNWKKEIQQFSDLSVRILGEKQNKKGKTVIGSVKDRLTQLKSPIHEFFTITNIETLRDDDVIKELCNPKSKNHYDMIIVDEIHKCVSSTSIQSKHLLKLKDIEYKLGLTGTLLLNSPEDCYVPLKWISAEKCNFTNYRYTYIKYGGPFGNIPQGYQNLDILKNQLNRYSLRRTKDLLDLPPKTIITKYIDLEGKHAQFYEDIKNGIVNDVDKVHMSTASLLSMVTRLRQATVLPSILTSENIPSCKLDYVEDLAKQIIEQGDKVVIFSTFKEPAYNLYDRLLKYNPVVCTGSEKDDIITSNVNKFQADDSCKCFIGTWQKCGTGITLTAASYMIFTDTAWTSAEYTQNQDRIYRIGTSKPVTIYNVVCNDTIDEHVLELVTNKEAISDYVIDDKVSDRTIDSLRKYISDLV